MRVKAIQDLAQLSDEALFSEIEIGAELCVSNAKQVHNDSLALDGLNRPAGTEILRLAAEEEAAKVLILLDAVRCQRSATPNEFNRQLQYFNDHLAKGIYAQYTWQRPNLFSEVSEWVERERKEYYLDGPNDVDWIFYNDILRRREETIYVDYVENDGSHIWHDPRQMDEFGATFASIRNPTLILVSALSEAGCLKATALKVIAEVWRPKAIGSDLTMLEVFNLNNEVLQKIHAAGHLKNHAPTIINEIANRWMFPLYPLDLRKCRVNKNDLREIQRAWSPYGDA